MATIIVSAISPKKVWQEVSFDGPTIESCFVTVTYLVNRGWQLHCVELIDQGSYTVLPTEAFDGSPLVGPLERLTQELKTIL